MKLIPLLIIGLIFYSCNKTDEVPDTEQIQKYFESGDLLKLKLDSVPEFWEPSDILKVNEKYYPYTIREDSDNAGLLISNKNAKGVGVVVFKSQEDAVYLMELRIKGVAAVILEGVDHKYFSGKWWYYDGSSIFVNKWNTIVEIQILGSDYKDVEKELIETASEIAQRVDKLSILIEE